MKQQSEKVYFLNKGIGDHTACAVAKPARGIATKLKSAAKTKRTPPKAPGTVNTTACSAIT